MVLDCSSEGDQMRRHRQSHRSSATPSSGESLRLSLTEETVVDVDYQQNTTWQPISSIQSSGFFNFSSEELEALDQQIEADKETEELTFDAVVAGRQLLDPPEEVDNCFTLVPWEEVPEDSLLKKIDTSSRGGSGTTEDLSCDPPSDASDIEPCEEHYRIPPAKDEPDQERQLVCRDGSGSIKSSREELIHGINTQLALVPLDSHSPHDKSAAYKYKHHFITVKEQHRFLLLYNFLKRNLHSKIILYFSTTKSTQYHYKLLTSLQFDVKAVHNGQSREKFLDTYLAFGKQKEGILCLPDFQECNIPPSVNWIVQYEPPGDPSEYIFRVGRISSERSSSSNNTSGAAGRYRALLFLTPHQHPFLAYFKAAHIKLHEYEMHNLSNVQRHYEKLVKRNDSLNKLGKEAYHSYLMNIASHEYRDVYDVHLLDREMVAKSFGFDKLPSSRSGGGNGSGGEEKERKIVGVGREENRWKPNKKDLGDQWTDRGKMSWRHADRHSHLMKKDGRIRS